MRERLSLQLHEGKIRIYDARCGVDFLGGFIKPYRNYISNVTLRRIEKKLCTFQDDQLVRRMARMNSLFGLLSHYSALGLQRRLLRQPCMSDDAARITFDGCKYKISEEAFFRQFI